MANPTTNTVITLAVVVIAAVVLFGLLTAPDQRSPTQKIGDAIHELPNGPDKAARQLENRTRPEAGRCRQGRWRRYQEKYFELRLKCELRLK